METRDAMLLGVVQGLTEFLPISSSAHLAALRRLTGDEHAPRAFDIALHLGTTAALVPAIHRDVVQPGVSLLRDMTRHRAALRRFSPEALHALGLAIATLPSVVVGAILHQPIERLGRRPGAVAVALALGSVWMALAEGRGHATPTAGAGGLRPARALLLGLAQAVALAPGVSRSGATIAAGMVLGLDRNTAIRLSFQLSAPVTLAATAMAAPELARVGRREGVPALVGIAAAYISGLAGIALLRRVLPHWGLLPFALYRCGLAFALWRLGRRDRR